MLRASRFTLVVSYLVLTLNAFAADWPQFRGPNADGIAPDEGINKSWQQKPPQMLWKVPLGVAVARCIGRACDRVSPPS